MLGIEDKVIVIRVQAVALGGDCALLAERGAKVVLGARGLIA